MKLKHIIIGLVSMLGIGAAVGAVNIHANQEETKVAEAATENVSTEKESIFLVGVCDNVGEWWLGNDQPCVWYWDSTETKGVTSQCVEITKITNYLGYFTLPYGVDHFKLLRTRGVTFPTNTYPSNHWNESSNFGICKDDGKLRNFVYVTKSGDGYSNATYSGTYTYIPSGTTLMFDGSNAKDLDWSSASASTYLYVDAVNDGNAFYGYTSSRSWFKLNRIGETKYYSTVIAEHVLSNIAIFTRANPTGQSSAGGSGWWLYDPDETTNQYHQVWNQTTDILSGYGFNPNFVTTLKNTLAGSNQDWSQGSYQDTTTVYGSYFINTMTCDGKGSVTDSSNWAKCKTSYDGLGKGVQGILWQCAPGDEYASQTTKDAMARYDYVIYKYTKSVYEDFIGRTNQGGGYQYGANVRTSLINIAVTNNGAAPIIISVIAVISLTAIGGYYFLSKNKKKENQ